MAAVLLTTLVAVVTRDAAVNTTFESLLVSAVQPVLTTCATKWATSFTFGLTHADGSVGLVAGMANPAHHIPAKPGDKYLWGSVTKTVTASAIMQLVDGGILGWGLGQPVSSVVDPLLKYLNGTTLEELFGAKIKNLTIGMLAGMTSGLQDYDTTELREWSYANPGKDISPIDVLHLVNKSWVCDPGTCSMYSSTNFELLGLVLAGSTGGNASWESYDQRSVIPPGLRWRYPSFDFAMAGPCSKYTDVHGFSWRWNGPPTDVSNISCLSGWTCGNLISPAQEVANFYYDLLGPFPRIVSGWSRLQMQQFAPFTEGWVTGMEYGLGMGPLPIEIDSGIRTQQHTNLVGHGGDTYGFASMAGYQPSLGFAVALGSSNETASNGVFNPQIADTLCLIFKAMYPVITTHLSMAPVPIECPAVSPPIAATSYSNSSVISSLH